MGLSTISPFAYTSILKFTVDGRPSVQDIHGLFSALISQVSFSTHRHRFRSYSNTFASHDAIRELGTLEFTRSFELTEPQTFTTTSTTMNRDMAKALIQQFIWTRLITNAVDPLDKTYRDKGLWRLSSKGLCVLQEFCVTNKRDIGKFVTYIDASARLTFLIQIERLKENDRLNCKRKYISCLFAIMIASLPLGNNESGKATTTTTSCEQDDISFSDYFPHIKTLPNDLLVGVGYKYPQQLSNQKSSSFQQQKALLQNLNPSSSSKKFKMRAIFTSHICCNWLIEFCTVASNDEAESIMTEFLNLGWIAFYDDKHRHSKYIESSKSITLNMTREGIQAVMDVCNDIQQQAVTVESSSSSLSNGYSMLPTLSSSRPLGVDKKERPTLQLHRCVSKLPLLPLLQTAALPTPVYDNSTMSYFDIKKQLNEAYTATTPPLTPTTPTVPTAATDYFANESSNSAKLGMVLNNSYLQSLFRDFLESNCCVQNLDFWIDHANLRKNCRRYHNSMPTANQKQLLEDAYALWEAYLEPGSATTLDIDTVTNTTAGQSRPTTQNLTTILNWLDKVNDQIFQSMAFDSIPKFIRTFEYKKAVYKLQTSMATNNDLDDFPPPPQRTNLYK